MEFVGEKGIETGGKGGNSPAEARGRGEDCGLVNICANDIAAGLCVLCVLLLGSLP